MTLDERIISPANRIRLASPYDESDITNKPSD